MKVINLFGGPGTGKSTTAAGVFHNMKLEGFNVELIAEFAKAVTWEKHLNLLEDQLYITAHQNRQLERLRGQVDFVISDSPLLLGIHYFPPRYYTNYKPLVKEVFDSYDNINFVLTRAGKYNPAGRYQTEDRAKEIDFEIVDLLDEYQTPYIKVSSKFDATLEIVEYIKRHYT